MDGNANASALKLPAVLDMAAAEGLLGAMRDRLRSGSPLMLDASAVETMTLPCMQIILAAQRSNDGIAIAQPSPAFVSAFADLGLDWGEPCAVNEAAPAGEIEQDNEADSQGQGDAQGQTEAQSAPDDQSEAVAATEPEQPAVTSEPGGEAVGLAAPMEEGPVAKRILTIDDSKTIRDMLFLTLNEAGFEVLQAVDGQDGLDVLDKEQVDVVVTDINMPRMDGYEVIRQMRRNAAYKSTPILVLTTESEAAKRNIAREAGATGWMVKPFDPDRLIATINKVAP